MDHSAGALRLALSQRPDDSPHLALRPATARAASSAVMSNSGRCHWSHRMALLHRWITVSGQAELMRCLARASAPRSGFAGFRFPPEVIMAAVRWYLRYGLSYRDVEELLAERGIIVDHVTVYRWVQRFTPLLIDAAGPCRHAPGDRWFVDETVRHEARCDRVGVRGLRRLVVAAAGLKLRAV
jgi:hypothetical protein